MFLNFLPISQTGACQSHSAAKLACQQSAGISRHSMSSDYNVLRLADRWADIWWGFFFWFNTSLSWTFSLQVVRAPHRVAVENCEACNADFTPCETKPAVKYIWFISIGNAFLALTLFLASLDRQQKKTWIEFLWWANGERSERQCNNDCS